MKTRVSYFLNRRRWRQCSVTSLELSPQSYTKFDRRGIRSNFPLIQVQLANTTQKKEHLWSSKIKTPQRLVQFVGAPMQTISGDAKPLNMLNQPNKTSPAGQDRSASQINAAARPPARKPTPRQKGESYAKVVTKFSQGYSTSAAVLPCVARQSLWLHPLSKPNPKWASFYFYFLFTLSHRSTKMFYMLDTFLFGKKPWYLMFPRKFENLLSLITVSHKKFIEKHLLSRKKAISQLWNSK